MKGELVDHNDVHQLVTVPNISHNPGDCRKFIDSSTLNLKSVLLHNGKVLPSSTVQYAVNKNKSRNNIKLLLNCINCNNTNRSRVETRKLLLYF